MNDENIIHVLDDEEEIYHPLLIPNPTLNPPILATNSTNATPTVPPMTYTAPNYTASTYTTRLKEMFPLRSHKQIDEIVATVLEQSGGSADENIEIMINMLMGDDDFGAGACGGGAAGFDKDSDMGMFYQNLLEMYPDICPQFLHCLLLEKGLDYENIVDELNLQKYEKVTGADKDPLVIWDNLKSLLPDADPDYLKKHAFELATKTDNDIRQFMETLLEDRDYPTMDSYLKKEKEQSKLRFYRNFDANKFLEAIPDPKAHFSSPTYINPLKMDGINEDDVNYALAFLYNKYPYQRRVTLRKAFKLFDRNLQIICELVDKFPKAIRNPRARELGPNTNNLALLQEVTYLTYKPVIQLFINRRNAIFQEAEKLGLLETCSTCYDQLIPENCYFCRRGCVYCKECLRKWAGILIGNGNLNFHCCDGDCNAEFTLITIKQVLDEDVFKTVAEQMQNEELRNAHIDGLELCPSCGFVVILNEHDKLIYCRNLKCRKTSCRECKHDDHTPLKCNEVEYAEDVRLRTYVEDKMTEALIRKCYRCQKPYVKSSGCNKIVCACGAMMCYLCNQAINGYNHFEGNNPCKLHTNDNNVDLQRVRYGAQTAKRDLGNVVIKFDPEENLNQFYGNN